ncbi:MAG TPA: transporter [Pyrinomonadaceae bacterium]|jgi:hypothetical protein
MSEINITITGILQTAKITSLGFFLLIFSLTANSQQLTKRTANSKNHSARQSQTEDEEDFIKPARPTVANPAEFQKPGVLQIEYGYDSNFRADDFRFHQSLPLNIRFAAHSRLLLETEIETVTSRREREGDRLQTGVGDTRLGFQIVAVKEVENRPALAFAYNVKIPTASESKMLGTGRYDHRVTALLSKKLGENTDLDVNAAFLNVGREDSDRRADGGLGAVSVSHEFENKIGFETEISGNSLDDVQPKGVYALGALTYKVNKRLRFDTGMRFGLTNEAPRVGFFAGFTLGAANLFKR